MWGLAATTPTGTLHLSTRTPTVSSFAETWIDEASTDPGFRRVRWDMVLPVPMITLDELITRHGEPRFCKIDVEGFEHEVLRGLEPAAPGTVVRYLPVAAERAIACVQRLAALGDYRFRRSRVETHRWWDQPRGRPGDDHRAASPPRRPIRRCVRGPA